MNVRTLTLILLLTGLPMHAHGDGYFLTGNEWHEMCRGDRVKAVIGSMALADGQEAHLGASACIRGTVTAKQVTDVFCRYLDEHPEERDAPAVLLWDKAAVSAWPCRAEAPKIVTRKVVVDKCTGEPIPLGAKPPICTPLARWINITVPEFLARHPQYAQGTPGYHQLDEKVKELQAVAVDPFNPEILENANKAIHAE